MRTVPALLTTLALVGCSKTVGDGDGIVDPDEVPSVGWFADFATHHHDTAGRATIIDGKEKVEHEAASLLPSLFSCLLCPGRSLRTEYSTVSRATIHVGKDAEGGRIGK